MTSKRQGNVKATQKQHLWNMLYISNEIQEECKYFT